MYGKIKFKSTENLGGRQIYKGHIRKWHEERKVEKFADVELEERNK